MREFKFRAWHKDDNKMYSGIPFPYVFEYNYQPFYIDEVTTDNLPMPIWEKCEWMQFTWLLDKKWNPIYEGDIVKSRTGNTAVEWKEYCFHFEDVWVLCQESAEQLEVIWNIYEHSHLIK